jgi:hypothetical protein
MKKLFDAPAMLVVMRVATMTKAHPKTDFTHRCARCHEPVGIFPSGQRLLREQPNVEIVCHGCAGDTTAIMLVLAGEALPGVRQRARQSISILRRRNHHDR